jgi:general secretion pathway protein B
VTAEGVPGLDDLPPSATAGLPVLNLDLHVYGPDAAKRFVFINNRRYVEGNSTPEGIRIERITPDGVILDHRGVRFLLARP